MHVCKLFINIPLFIKKKSKVGNESLLSFIQLPVLLFCRMNCPGFVFPFVYAGQVLTYTHLCPHTTHTHTHTHTIHMFHENRFVRRMVYKTSLVIDRDLPKVTKTTWDFFGRTDAEAETPILWPPHAKS